MIKSPEAGQGPDISIVIPVYNEAGAVVSVLGLLRQTLEKISSHTFEIIMVDDFSRDDSVKLLRREKDIKLIENPYNVGYGASLKRGIREARGDWIFIFDADATYPIGRLPDFLPHLGTYDMVVGARINNTEVGANMRHFRIWSKRFLNHLASYLSGFPILDLNSGMRIFRRSMALEFWNLYPQRFSFTSTITMAFVRSGYFIKYIPIDYHQRIGQTSIKPVDFLRFLSLILRIAFYFNPLRMFRPAIVLALGVGLIKGAIDYFHEGAIGNLSVLLVTTSALLWLWAVFADLLFKQRRM